MKKLLLGTKTAFILVVWVVGIGAPAGALHCPQGDTLVRAVRGVVVETIWRGRPGAALPGVTVTLTRGRWTRQVVADLEGAFSFPELPPGDYQLLAKLPGFQETRSTIRVRPRVGLDRVLVVNMVLTLDDCAYVEQVSPKEVRRRLREEVGSRSSVEGS